MAPAAMAGMRLALRFNDAAMDLPAEHGDRLVRQLAAIARLGFCRQPQGKGWGQTR